MAVIDYNLFYRRYGVRRLQNLTKPLVYETKFLQLPKNSLVHYVDESGLTTGPNLTEPYYSNQAKLLMVEHLTALTVEKGSARPLVKPIERIIREYHLKNRKSRPLRNFETANKDPITTIIESYALIPSLYRYVTSYYSAYNSWWNIQATLWNRVNELAEITDRHQFVFLRLPQVLPSLGILRLSEKQTEVTRKLVDSVPESMGLMLVQLWTWLGENRSNSVMARLSPKALEQTNLVWQESGRWFVINLGLLDQWRIDTQDTDTTMVQRRWLRAMITVLGLRSAQTEETADSVDVIDTPADTGTDTEIPIEEFDDDSLDDLDALPTADMPLVSESVIDDTLSDADVFASVTNTDDELSEIERVETLDVETDLKELDALTQPPKSLNTLYSSYQGKTEFKPDEAVVEIADSLYKEGLINPLDYKTAVQNAKRYKAIKNPFNRDESLEQGSVIDPALLKITDRNIVGPIPGVLDTSMFQSSLVKFDSQYIEKVLPKDVLNSVLGIQAAGICIQSYDVETVETLTDHYQVHTVKIAPVVGKPSTLKFKLPVIDPNGTFKAGNSLYTLRKQRNELPIRKVSPSRVALTSYYSKLFVERSERRVNNYAQWLVNNVRRMGLDPNNTGVSNLKLQNVFDHELMVPRVYSILSTAFSGFTVGDYQLVWDYARRPDYPLVEKDNRVVVGLIKDNVLAMDSSNGISEYTPDGKLVKELGLIEELIKLPLEERPLEYAEIGIMGQSTPIGVVLGRMVGLGTLLKTLKVTPKRYSAKVPVQLTATQYALRFSDQTLVFERGDPKVDLIMSGFNRYYRDIRRFSVFQFDKTDVYDVVFERNEFGPRYIRELGLLRQLWVDHITREILVDMKEPTDLVGLFLRATELLTTDYHPAPMDMRFMRDRGYERIAGNLYTELSRAIRAYKARPMTKQSAVELNPQAVWLGLMQDPSKAMVEQSNPIHNLKEKEVVVYSGRGGRGSRTMTAPTRKYHKTHLGVVSEATVDNSDVATTTYLVADPNYVSVRGLARQIDFDTDGPARQVSTSMLTAPGSDRD